VLRQIFLDHPRSVGETYLAHQRQAFGFGLSMIGAGLACMLHGLIPAMFLHTGSEMVTRLHHRMVVNRTAPRGPTALAAARRI
jgi:hypothetical protein